MHDFTDNISLSLDKTFFAPCLCKIVTRNFSCSSLFNRPFAKKQIIIGMGKIMIEIDSLLFIYSQMTSGISVENISIAPFDISPSKP